MAEHPMERLAVNLFQTAINRGQAGELLECLFDGGSATIDPVTGEIVMVTEDLLNQMMGGLEE